MFEYFQTKLQDLNRRVKSTINDVIASATNDNITRIKENVDRLSKLKERLDEIQKDAVQYLTVEQVLTLIRAGQLTHDIAAYVYRYNKPVTLAERDILVKIDYSYKDIRIK